MPAVTNPNGGKVAACRSPDPDCQLLTIGLYLLWKTSIIYFLFNIYFTLVILQPNGYNVTCQLQEPKALIRPATAKAVFLKKPYFNRPRLCYYKHSSSFNPHTRFLKHLAETKELHKSNGILSRASMTLNPWPAAQQGIEPATLRLQAQ
jgi:hypothetical protein